MDVAESAEGEVRVEVARRASHLRNVAEILPGIIHDLNNPLGVVVGHADLLADCEDLAEVEESVSPIRDAVTRCGGLLRGLLELVEPHDPGHPGADLRRVVEELLPLTRKTMERVGVELAAELPVGDVRVGMPEPEVRELLLHLLVRTRHEFVGAGRAGKCKVRVSRAGAALVLEVLAVGGAPASLGPGEDPSLGVCRDLVANAGGALELCASPEHSGVRVRFPVLDAGPAGDAEVRS